MKTIKQAKVKSETELAVDAYLVEIGVAYSVLPAGKGLKRDGWECDGWCAAFTKGDGREAHEQFDFYTGVGHRAIDEHEKRRIVATYGKASQRNLDFHLNRAAQPFAPFAASVLYSLVNDAGAAHMSFRDWCGDYGYDSDSLKALGIYNACSENAERLRRVFTREQIAHIQNLLADY